MADDCFPCGADGCEMLFLLLPEPWGELLKSMLIRGLEIRRSLGDPEKAVTIDSGSSKPDRRIVAPRALSVSHWEERGEDVVQRTSLGGGMMLSARMAERTEEPSFPVKLVMVIIIIRNRYDGRFVGYRERDICEREMWRIPHLYEIVHLITKLLVGHTLSLTSGCRLHPPISLSRNVQDDRRREFRIHRKGLGFTLTL
jgi:hypothetical protein